MSRRTSDSCEPQIPRDVTLCSLLQYLVSSHITDDRRNAQIHHQICHLGLMPKIKKKLRHVIYVKLYLQTEPNKLVWFWHQLKNISSQTLPHGLVAPPTNVLLEWLSTDRKHTCQSHFLSSYWAHVPFSLLKMWWWSHLFSGPTRNKDPGNEGQGVAMFLFW